MNTARRSRLAAFALTLSLAAALGGCASPAESTAHQQQAVWTGKRPAKYQFTFRWSCFCGPDFTEPVKITVENDKITQVTVVATGMPAAKPADYRTIDGLFTFIQEAVDRNAAVINATYDAKWGFPSNVSVDYVVNAADEEMAFTASDLVALP